MNDMSFAHLILGASPVVQFIMLLLVLMSGASWFVIFKKRMTLRDARQSADAFEDEFWSGIDLATLYTRVNGKPDGSLGMEAIFLAGFQEFLRLRNQHGVEPETVVGSAQRAMRAALTREIDELEMHLGMLATTGSVSPYFGLFGTVWGVMNSFRALAGVKQVTLAQVAPGIAEALIATAIGLFAAIPAVIAYNRYVGDVERLIGRYETFIDEFSNILQRQFYSLRGTARVQPVTQPAVQY